MPGSRSELPLAVLTAGRGIFSLLPGQVASTRQQHALINGSTGVLWVCAACRPGRFG